eukprot:CFRG6665T1
MTDAVQVRLLFFARSRELAGTSETSIQVPKTTTVNNLLKIIVKHYPQLEPVVDSVAVAVNEEFQGNSVELTLTAGDIVAIIPPISGG